MAFPAFKLDTTLNIGMIAIFLVNIIGLVWFSSKLDSRVTTLESFRDAAIVRLNRQDEIGNQIKVDVAVAKEDISSILAIVRRMQDNQDRDILNSLPPAPPITTPRR